MKSFIYLHLAAAVLVVTQLEAQVTPATRQMRYREFWLKRVSPGTTIPDGAVQRALQQAATLRSAVPQVAAAPNERWVNIGPTPMFSTTLVPVNGGYSGRVSCLAVDPANPNHWLAGPATGGVWESTDAGATWAPRSDYEASLAMGAIAFAPSDSSTIYVGTGEGHGSNSYPGEGLLKSTNGGLNWTLIATNLFANASFSVIRVSPSDETLLYAASLPSLNVDGDSRVRTAPTTGFHRSTDGGQNWTRTLTGNATDIDVNPTDFNSVLAALGNSAGDNTTNDVYRSTDGGMSWTKLGGPWVASNAAGRIRVAVAPSNPNTAYVSVQDFTKMTDNLLGVWRSANIWSTTPTWTQLASPATPLGDQWDYDHCLSVSPTNESLVFLGGTTLYRLDGTAWTAIGGQYVNGSDSQSIHPDMQAMAWVGTRLIVGNDGGVFSTPDNGTNWTDHNTTLATIQIYSGSVHPTRPDHAILGAQDNSCSVWRGTNSTWSELTGGDGTATAYSYQNPDTRWLYADQKLTIYRTLDGGATRADTPITTGLPTSGTPFIGPVVIDPFNEDIALAGHTNIYRCTNIFSGNTPTWIFNGPTTTLPIFGTVTTIAISLSDTTGNTYAFGTDIGELRMTGDAGATWRDLFNASDLPARTVSKLAFHPTDPNTLYAVFSGFDDSTPTRIGHLFRTTNALAVTPSWVNIGPAVNIPHNAIAIDPNHPNTLYLGTDIGIWRSLDAGTTWTQLGQSYNFPNVPVFDIKINSIGRVLAFTHGRSVFALVSDNDRTLATSVSGGNLVLSLSSLAVYPVVQTTTSLSGTPAWTNAGTLYRGASGYSITNSLTDPARFFRAQTQ